MTISSFHETQGFNLIELIVSWVDDIIISSVYVV